MLKNILFITWDGAQTSYMDGLFIPIFEEIMKQNRTLKFHILQFTWADADRVQQIAHIAAHAGIAYHAVPIQRKPFAAIGSMISLLTGRQKVEKYIQRHHIEIVMPRSTFPSFMVQQIKNKKFRIIFDADGLPIEERVDFAGLKKGGQLYHWMKSIERKMLLQADAVITRSKKAIDQHLQAIGEGYRQKFSVVYNGRNIEHFAPDIRARNQARKKLQIQDEELLWVYAGSLGPQYCWEEMLAILTLSQKLGPSKFLVLTGDISFAETRIPDHLKDHIILESVDFEHIPFYLNAADAAFALRRPTCSMMGVAPIKLGEYLLMGIPTIASAGIGDTEDILNDFPECFIFYHNRDAEIQNKEITCWIEETKQLSKTGIRTKALPVFSLSRAAQSYLFAIANWGREFR